MKRFINKVCKRFTGGITIEGIILAGGYSSRAKTNKMALLYHSKPLIVSTIESMKPHVTKIVVVSGHYHEALKMILKDDSKVVVVKNETYDEGMFSSVKVGMAQTSSDVVIIPGDVPLVNGSTYTTLVNAKGTIRVPTHKGRKGHPIFIARTHREALLKAKTTSHLKAFRDAVGFETVPVDDSGILVDIDTKEDYHQMIHENKEERTL